MNRLMRPIPLLTAGVLLGIAAKLLDFYAANLANLFSEFSIWILFGVLISLYSQTRGKAAGNVFCFCAGMLAAYYPTALSLAQEYSSPFLVGWSIFCLISPLFAAITWTAGEPGILPKLLSLGIISVTLLASAVFFDGPRLYDFIIALALLYFLFLKKIRR